MAPNVGHWVYSVAGRWSHVSEVLLDSNLIVPSAGGDFQVHELEIKFIKVYKNSVFELLYCYINLYCYRIYVEIPYIIL